MRESSSSGVGACSGSGPWAGGLPWLRWVGWLRWRSSITAGREWIGSGAIGGTRWSPGYHRPPEWMSGASQGRMRIHLISVGRRMPPWVEAGYGEYAKRLPAECALHLVEVEPLRRLKGGSPGPGPGRGGGAHPQRHPQGGRGDRPGCRRPGLEHGGAGAADPGWMGEGRDRALLVGGADGLSIACLERADQRWSLSNLTFPHQLVRVLVAEQIYRAWSLLKGHPYHRA